MGFVNKYPHERQHPGFPAAGFNVVAGGYMRMLQKDGLKSKHRSKDKADEVATNRQTREERSEQRQERNGCNREGELVLL